MNVEEVLECIHELGFYSKDKIILPKFTVHEDRIELVLRYLKDYFSYHIDDNITCFFTVYDGWRECSEPSTNPLFIQATRDLISHYTTNKIKREPGRFIAEILLKDIFPKFIYPILSMGRHKNDKTVILIPDTDFIKSYGYITLRKEIENNDIDYSLKIPQIFWRGGNHGPKLLCYSNDDNPKSIRENVVSLNNKITSINAYYCINATKKEMLRYKYLLDVDGEVNAWSGLYWKLLSNSVVFKVESHWEQWYYKDLKEWIHYIPVKSDLTDIEEKFNWAISHDEDCRLISKNATEFAKRLTYDYVIKNYKIE